MPPDDATTASPSPPEMKSALKMFRKRLKFMRLDDESKLGGHGAMTGGKRSGVVGIAPPKEFSQAVWDALANEGKLKYLGHGLYELREP